jgi:hypothetical protein
VKLIIAFLKSHGTKVLGFAQGTIATLCGVAGIIPDAHLKYWLAASALLTFWRGFVNTAIETPTDQP